MNTEWILNAEAFSMWSVWLSDPDVSSFEDETWRININRVKGGTMVKETAFQVRGTSMSKGLKEFIVRLAEAQVMVWGGGGEGQLGIQVCALR